MNMLYSKLSWDPGGCAEEIDLSPKVGLAPETDLGADRSIDHNGLEADLRVVGQFEFDLARFL